MAEPETDTAAAAAGEDEAAAGEAAALRTPKIILLALIGFLTLATSLTP